MREHECCAGALLMHARTSLSLGSSANCANPSNVMCLVTLPLWRAVRPAPLPDGPHSVRTQDNDAIWVNDFDTSIIPHTDVVAIGAEVRCWGPVQLPSSPWLSQVSRSHGKRRCRLWEFCHGVEGQPQSCGPKCASVGKLLQCETLSPSAASQASGAAPHLPS